MRGVVTQSKISIGRQVRVKKTFIIQRTILHTKTIYLRFYFGKHSLTGIYNHEIIGGEWHRSQGLFMVTLLLEQ